MEPSARRPMPAGVPSCGATAACVDARCGLGAASDRRTSPTFRWGGRMLRSAPSESTAAPDVCVAVLRAAVRWPLALPVPCASLCSGMSFVLSSAASIWCGGLAASASPYGLPHPGRSRHPSSSCTIGTAPRSCRCRMAHRRLPAARRDRRSGRRLGGRGAHSLGTSRRARHARHAARGRSAAARPACCRGRCAGCDWTGGRARCSGYQRGW